MAMSRTRALPRPWPRKLGLRRSLRTAALLRPRQSERPDRVWKDRPPTSLRAHAKQSMAPHLRRWIASSLALLAMTAAPLPATKPSYPTRGAGLSHVTAADVCTDLSASSWPGLSRPSTSLHAARKQDVDARHKAGHDEFVEP